jgi:molybdopterin synthase sulfur carrier subunit
VTAVAGPTVTVRFWAGAKAAAGVAEQHVVATTLAEALEQVRQGRDERFTDVLKACSFVVSEQPVGKASPADVPLTAGDVVEVLPPFAGGSQPVDHTVARAEVQELPSWRPPMLSALLGVVLMAGAVAGPAYLWVGVGLGQLLLVLSWHRSLRAADALVGMVVGAVLIVAADIAVALDDGPVSFGPISVVVAVGFLLAVVQQLARRDERSDLTMSLSATVSLAAIGALGAGWAITPRLAEGEELTLVAATAVTAAAIGRLAPGIVGSVLGPLGAGVAAGALLGSTGGQVGTGWGAAVGAAAALPALLAAVGQLRLPARAAGWPAGAVWPVLVASPLVYLVVRLGGY